MTTKSKTKFRTKEELIVYFVIEFYGYLLLNYLWSNVFHILGATDQSIQSLVLNSLWLALITVGMMIALQLSSSNRKK